VDNFQLTLADAEVRKKKEAMLLLEDQHKFDDLKNPELDMKAKPEHSMVYLLAYNLI